ncbi:Pls/PosA family non-ribosomal peptide synthetase [Leeia oryzae]|uniref:Pls/PosA family non-ribosomal peptide synthetase n=1 Tax=Leeia oryzae TaxID=356662 RepID=UPI0003A8908E|nr:Pls/PosA family non-ribosomal peptide synthetase [Leeia oryzae]
MSYSAPKILFGPHVPDLLREETLPDLLEATAARIPHKTALTFQDKSLTYEALNHQADIVAHHLIANGVKAGDMVGLWLPRGMDLLVAMAGITKAGAAWLPMDADIPLERVLDCLSDANAVGIVTLASCALPAGIAVWTVTTLTQDPIQPLLRRQGHTPDHPAYVIYTSGSTGKPKGIQIHHRSICHFLRSENHELGIREEDHVYQGFSAAFDMSFEEIWISYLVGASLWIAPKELVSDPQALPKALREAGITVMHAVPTLLALFAEEVPSLRIINLGGEMCPDALVDKWAIPGRQMFNTYGPTEATVSASLARLQAGTPVTIGKPLPNYGLLVISEQGHAVPAGEVGELCIFGPGVSYGYLGRPDLTAEKFIANPYAEHPQNSRLYRTGDLASIDEEGNVQCLGRADDQIKIRGFRVELGEIEAVLCEQPHVGTAAVLLKQLNGLDQLVAFIATEGDTRPTLSALRQGLRSKLPAYMEPAYVEFLETIPRLTSGKIDRKALKARELSPQEPDEEEDEPQNPAEVLLFGILKKLFPGQPVRLGADFFDDMGGHSLLAARLVSEVRQQAAFACLTVQDVYRRRSVGGIAQAILQLQNSQTTPAADHTHDHNNSTLRRLRCGIAQAIALPPLIALRILHWLAPFFTYHMLTGEETDSIPFALLMSIGVFLLSILASFLIPVVMTRLLQGHMKPGKYPLWGIQYFRWWLSNRFLETVPVNLISGSSLYPVYLRALGAKVGKETVIGSMTIRVPSLLSLGYGVSIGSSANFENAHVEAGELHVGRIALADEAYVGSYAVLAVDTRIEAHGHLEGLSSLPQGTRLPKDERWAGAPAAFKEQLDHAQLPHRVPASRARITAEHLMYLTGAMFMAVLFFVPIFPAFVLVDWLDASWLDLSEGSYSAGFIAFVYFLLAIPATAILILTTALLSAAVRWAVLPRLEAGSWSVHSHIYYRKWLTNQIQEASLSVLHGVYATLYAPWWYRLLGARIGKGAEISTAMGVVPDMLTLGDDTFIADAVMLGDDEIDAGWMTIRPTVIGDRSFVGNGAYVPDGTILPEGVLIGVQSTVPPNADIRSGDTWMGSPSMRLPAREQLAGFPEHLTFRPSWRRRLARGLIEAARIVLPQALIIGVGYLIVLNVLPQVEDDAWGTVFGELALDGVLYGVGCFLFVILLKWVLIGRYQPKAAPMWTPFVWLSEAVTNLYESIAVPNSVNFLRGTPMLPWLLRLMGAKIGKGVYLDTTDITEFDCAHIGDNVEMNALTGPQTHLFEDRIMKIGQVRIEAGATVHPRGTVLYDATVGKDARLGPLTLVMKGENIPAGTRWIGSPASPWAGTPTSD